MATYTLVGGAWLGGWRWQSVADPYGAVRTTATRALVILRG